MGFLFFLVEVVFDFDVERVDALNSFGALFAFTNGFFAFFCFAFLFFEAGLDLLAFLFFLFLELLLLFFYDFLFVLFHTLYAFEF